MKKTIADNRIIFGGIFTAIGLVNILTIRSPVSEYKLSVYGDLSKFYWLVVLGILLISVYSLQKSNPRHWNYLSIIAVGLGVFSVVILPLSRGFFFWGEFDALTHLGFAMDIQSGNLSPFNIPYPLLHVLSILVSNITRHSLGNSLLMITFLFPIIYIIFIPLIVRRIYPDRIAMLFAIFSGLYLLPIGHISSHLHPHPSSQAVLYVPVLVFFFILTSTSAGWRWIILFVCGSITIILLHPLQGANVLALFVGAACAQVINKKTRAGEKLISHRNIIITSLIFGFLFWIWIRNLSVFATIFRGFVVSILEQPNAPKTVERAALLSELGGDPLFLFLKLFAVPLLYCIATGLTMLAVVITQFYGWKSDLRWAIPNSEDSRTRLLYLTAGFIPVTALFIGFIFSGQSDIYHRFLAFMLVIVTIIGSVSFARMCEYLCNKFAFNQENISRLIVIFLLVLTLPVIHSSPFIYKSSQHVTEAQYHGHKTAFEHQSTDIKFENIGSPVSRYGHGIRGTTEIGQDSYYPDGVESPGGVPDHFADRSLPNNMSQTTYLSITSADYARSQSLYRGHFFSQEDFAYLNRDPQIGKVQSNGGFELYLVTTQEQ